MNWPLKCRGCYAAFGPRRAKQLCLAYLHAIAVLTTPQCDCDPHSLSESNSGDRPCTPQQRRVAGAKWPGHSHSSQRVWRAGHALEQPAEAAYQGQPIGLSNANPGQQRWQFARNRASTTACHLPAGPIDKRHVFLDRQRQKSLVTCPPARCALRFDRRRCARPAGRAARRFGNPPPQSSPR